MEHPSAPNKFVHRPYGRGERSSKENLKVCPRCKHSKDEKEFINSRKKIGKYCSECLEKSRKYFNKRSKCEHERMVHACPWCNNATTEPYKPVKKRAKIQKIVIGDDGSVNVQYDRTLVSEKIVKNNTSGVSLEVF